MKFNPKEIAASIRQNRGNLSAVARSFGCSRATIYGYRADPAPVFDCIREAIVDSRGAMQDLAQENYFSILEDGDHPDFYKATRDILFALGKNDGFTSRQELDVTTKGQSINREWTIVDAPPPDADE